MTQPNRKYRRAMEAQSRKAMKSAGTPSPATSAQIELMGLQRKYDDKVLQIAAIEQELQRLQAQLAGVLLEVGDEVTISAETIEFLQEGGVSGLAVSPTEEGGVVLALVLSEEGIDDDGLGEDTDEEE